jgi:glutathione peroxidase
MRVLIFFMGYLFMTSIAANEIQPGDTAYAYSFETLMGHKPLPLEAYQGKVLLIVNTASKCGFTPQYAGLETLYKTYKDKGLIVIGVPSNDFGHQEPGSEEDIADFCQINYGVTFPITTKEIVKGKNAAPFYVWAKQKLGFGTAPKWNFHKYLINRKGELIDYFNSTTSPEAGRFIKAVENALDEKS